MAVFFGSAAKCSVIANQVPSQVENEEELLQQLRIKLGPDPDHDRLLYHIRTARGKVHWAVNSYLREIMARPSSSTFSRLQASGNKRAQQPTTQPLFAPLCNTQPEQLHSNMASKPSRSFNDNMFTVGMQEGIPSSTNNTLNVASNQILVSSLSASVSMPALPPNGTSATCICHPQATDYCVSAPSTQGLDSLPTGVLECIVDWIHDPCTLASLAMTCKTLHAVATHNRPWQRLFQMRWGNVVFPTNPGRALSSRARLAAVSSSVPSTRSSLSIEVPSLPQNSELNGIHQPHVTGTSPSSPETSSPAAGDACGVQNGTAFSDTCQTSVHLNKEKHVIAQQQCGNGMQLASSPQSSTRTAAGTSKTRRSSEACSWHDRYKQQLEFEKLHSCPCCGSKAEQPAPSIVPIVYGFPAPALLEGMRAGRLVLGGDHLIDDCHVWACNDCNACFRYGVYMSRDADAHCRTYPYEAPQLWREDHAQLQERAAALKQSLQSGSAAPDTEHLNAHQSMLPTYTYEL